MYYDEITTLQHQKSKLKFKVFRLDLRLKALLDKNGAQQTILKLEPNQKEAIRDYQREINLIKSEITSLNNSIQKIDDDLDVLHKERSITLNGFAF